MTSYLVSDLYQALTGQAHPARPSESSKSSRYADLRARLDAQRARMKTAPVSD